MLHILNCRTTNKFKICLKILERIIEFIIVEFSVCDSNDKTFFPCIAVLYVLFPVTVIPITVLFHLVIYFSVMQTLSLVLFRLGIGKVVLVFFLLGY